MSPAIFVPSSREGGGVVVSATKPLDAESAGVWAATSAAAGAEVESAACAVAVESAFVGAASVVLLAGAACRCCGRCLCGCLGYWGRFSGLGLCGCLGCRGRFSRLGLCWCGGRCRCCCRGLFGGCCRCCGSGCCRSLSKYNCRSDGNSRKKCLVRMLHLLTPYLLISYSFLPFFISTKTFTMDVELRSRVTGML